MVGGALQHIAQHYKNATFSEVYYYQSVAGIVEANFNQLGARCIFMQVLYWTPTGSAAPFNFLDQFGKILLQTFDDAVGIPTWFPITQVKQGPLLKVSSSLNTINFSISFQYIL